MSEKIKGRLNVNWDSYWNGFAKIPLMEPLRFFLIKRACDQLLRSFAPRASMTFCELGAGTGSVGRYIANRYQADLALVDSNPKALILCNEGFKDFKAKGEVINRDVFDLKEYAGCFDLVHSGGLIEHFVDDSRDAIIKAHTDLVKKGGYVLILVPTENWWYRLLNYGVFKLMHLLDEIPEIPWSLKELRASLDRHGLDIVATTSVISEIGVLAKQREP